MPTILYLYRPFPRSLLPNGCPLRQKGPNGISDVQYTRRVESDVPTLDLDRIQFRNAAQYSDDFISGVSLLSICVLNYGDDLSIAFQVTTIPCGMVLVHTLFCPQIRFSGSSVFAERTHLVITLVALPIVALCNAVPDVSALLVGRHVRVGSFQVGNRATSFHRRWCCCCVLSALWQPSRLAVPIWHILRSACSSMRLFSGRVVPEIHHASRVHHAPLAGLYAKSCPITQQNSDRNGPNYWDMLPILCKL